MSIKKTRKLSGLLIYSYLKDGPLQQLKGMRRSKQVFERVKIFLQKVYGTGYLFRQMVSKELRSWTSGRSLPVWKYCSVPPLRGPDLMIHVFPVRLLHDGQFSDEKSLYYNLISPGVMGSRISVLCRPWNIAVRLIRCASFCLTSFSLFLVVTTWVLFIKFLMHGQESLYPHWYTKLWYFTNLLNQSCTSC